MKTKITLTMALFGFICHQSTAQITVTNADVAPFGNIAIIAHDTIPAPTILAGLAGASSGTVSGTGRRRAALTSVAGGGGKARS